MGNGIFFGGLLRKKSLGEIFNKYGLRPEIICNSGRQQTKSLTKIPNQNALEFLASGKDFVMDRIGDARNLNENLENNL